MITPYDVDERNRRILRAMAWERAKGEMRSMFVCFYGEPANFDFLREKIEAFIEDIEDHGLQK